MIDTTDILLAGYLVLAVTAVALTLAGRDRGSQTLAHVTVLRALMRRPAVRWLILVLWLWVGWHFFVR